MIPWPSNSSKWIRKLAADASNVIGLSSISVRLPMPARTMFLHVCIGKKTNQASKAGFKICENRNPPRRNTMRVLVLQYTRILSHPSLWVRHREIHWDMLKWATHNSSTEASAIFKHSSPKHPKQFQTKSLKFYPQPSEIGSQFCKNRKRPTRTITRVLVLQYDTRKFESSFLMDTSKTPFW